MAALSPDVFPPPSPAGLAGVQGQPQRAFRGTRAALGRAAKRHQGAEFLPGLVLVAVARAQRSKRSKLKRYGMDGNWSDRLDAGRPLRVIIAGGGPGGLALARGLVELPGLEIRILEGRPEVKTGGARATGRSHTIGLGRRAREAILQVGGKQAWEQLCSKGILADGFTLHLNGVPLSLPPPEGEPVVLVDRSAIVAELKDLLMSSDFAAGTDVKIEYSTRVHTVDVVHRHVTVRRGSGEEELLDYDLLVGSDGVRSRVREAMNSQLPPGRFESELRVMPGRWMVLRLDLPEGYSKSGVHAMVASDAPFGLFCIPDKAGPHCVIASWSSEEPPRELLEATDAQQLEAVLLRYFPQLGRIPREAAEEFLSSQPSKAVVSRCRPLHAADHAICVLGDAAHAVGGGSLGQGCSAALQDAAALAECLQEGARLNQELLRTVQQRQEKVRQESQEWSQVREEAVVSSLAAFSERRAEEAWALLDLIELQSAAEVRASALVQGPLVFGFFIEQLGRGTLRPLADLGGRLLDERLRNNWRSSSSEVSEFVTHLQMKPTMNFSPGVLIFLIEQFVLGIWKAMLDIFSRLQPPMQTALMSTDESYSELVGRNQTWLALLRSAKAAAGVTRISSLRKIKAFAEAPEEVCALFVQNFTEQERLQDDVLLRQSAPVDQQNFYAILAGSCEVKRDKKVVAQLSAGDSFGEAALLLQAPSPISIKETSDLQLLVMKGQVFCELMEKTKFRLYDAMEAAAERYGMSFQEVVTEQEDGRKRVRGLLEEAVDSLAITGAQAVGHAVALPDLDGLLGTVGVESYVQGDLVALGCQKLRVLEQGHCNVVRGGRTIRTLQAGTFFGPDLAADERVVAASDEVRVCSFSNEAVTSMGLLLNQQSS